MIPTYSDWKEYDSVTKRGSPLRDSLIVSTDILGRHSDFFVSARLNNVLNGKPYCAVGNNPSFSATTHAFGCLEIQC